MFLHHLGLQSERDAFYRLAQELVAADGKLLEAEKDILAFIVQQAEVDVDKSTALTTAEAAARLTSPASRRATLLELIGISLCDGAVSAEELRIINDLAQLFGIEAREVDEMRSWTEGMLKHTADGERLIVNVRAEVD
jgi:uncharacterized tellurite resistance protein B-like protein